MDMDVNLVRGRLGRALQQRRRPEHPLPEHDTTAYRASRLGLTADEASDAPPAPRPVAQPAADTPEPTAPASVDAPLQMPQHHAVPRGRSLRRARRRGPWRRGTFKLPEALLSALKSCAAQHHKYQYTVVTEALEQYLLRSPSGGAAPVAATVDRTRQEDVPQELPAPEPVRDELPEPAPPVHSRRRTHRRGVLEVLLSPLFGSHR